MVLKTFKIGKNYFTCICFQYSSFLFEDPSFYLVPYAFNMHCRVYVLATNSHFFFFRNTCKLWFYIYFWILFLARYWILRFFITLKMSFYCLLVCIVSEEKLAVTNIVVKNSLLNSFNTYVMCVSGCLLRKWINPLALLIYNLLSFPWKRMFLFLAF